MSHPKPTAGAAERDPAPRSTTGLRSSTGPRSTTDPSDDVTVDDLGSMRSAFDELLGLEYAEVGAGRLVATLHADSRLHQPFGIVHGGVYASLIETVASVGAWLSVRRSGATAVGVHNATDFIRPHVEGPLRVVGHAVHEGRTQHLWQVDISREVDGKLVARGQVRLAILPADD